MILIEKQKCTGCMSCKSACPRNAIQIIEDEKTGFLYPKINKEYCINCGICKSVCPVKNKLEENLNKIDVYACKNKNEEIRLQSSSGGIFTLVANYILDNNGVADDNLSLLNLIDFIKRSAISKGEKVLIYLPSIRMRRLLREFLEREM